MGLKQKTTHALVSQFHRPHGFGGRVAGWVMANRGSNRERNIWAVGLLDVQAQDRVLEIGFGPGIAIQEFARPRRAARRRRRSLRGDGPAGGTNAAAVSPAASTCASARRTRCRLSTTPFDKILAVNS